LLYQEVKQNNIYYINELRDGVKYSITTPKKMDIVKAFNANDLHTEVVIKRTKTDP
jgi:hypothetical protein